MSAECQDCNTPAQESERVEKAVEGHTSTSEFSTLSEIPNPYYSKEVLAEINPPGPAHPQVIIEFCDRCRWAPRASWIQTELLLTFPTPLIKTVTLIPLTSPETGGRFRVWLNRSNGTELIWDRKSEGGFPELKVLKQRVRNLIQPDMGLGHSDAKTSST